MASTPTPQPIPDGYRRVTPALVVDGAARALEFYADVFGATERRRTPPRTGRSPTPRSRSATRS
jgi:PhnB protein